MLCTLLLSLSANCKNAMLKLTQNTSGKVIATNGSEVCKIGRHYPPPVEGRELLKMIGGGSLFFQSGCGLSRGPLAFRLQQGYSPVHLLLLPSLSAVEEVPGARVKYPAGESPPAASFSDQWPPNGEGLLTLKFKEITQNQRLRKGKWVTSSNL